jgi:hypothetical protein
MLEMFPIVTVVDVTPTSVAPAAGVADAVGVAAEGDPEGDAEVDGEWLGKALSGNRVPHATAALSSTARAATPRRLTPRRCDAP